MSKEMKTQPSIAILILVIVVIVAVFASVMIPPGGFERSRLKTFVTIFAGLSLILTVMFYYILIRLQAVQSELLELREMQEIQDSVLIVNKQITTSAKVIPEFCTELMPLQVKSIGHHRSAKTDDIEKVSTENELSWLIFNVFQIVILEYKFIKEQETYYTRLFLQWATSKRLRKNWNTIKIALIPSAQQFGELLFRFAPKENKSDPESYIIASDALQETTEYRKLFCI